jgi:phosphoglycerate dehydrogenase-like enzyme
VTTVLIEASIVADADRVRLVDRFPAVHFTFVDNAAAWNDHAAAAEVIFAKGVPSAAVQRAGSLRWLQVGTAGVDRWLGSDIIGRGVVLTNASGAHGVPIAEQVLAMALSFATGLNILMRARGEHRDARRRVYAQKFELEGQTMLVIGLGDIGGTLAAKAQALGLRVLGVRRSGRATEHCAVVVTPDRLSEVLPQADHVALCLPLTTETKGIIGARELRLMKPSAYVYNVGRGVAIDGTALRQALREGWIAGAGLDCLAPTDVPPPDDPLWHMDNVILGLHTSGSSPQNSRRITDIFMANLERYLAGQPLQNAIDPAAGY